MRLFLIRHGQTSWNLEERAQGHTDIPLDETGKAQAEMVCRFFADLPAPAILSSDLQRCTYMAELLSTQTGGEVKLRKALREKCFGDWEGSPFSFIREHMPTGPGAFTFRPPNGESFEDVWTRLDPVVDELRELNHDHAVVLSHGGASAMLLAKLLNANFETSRAFRFGNAALTELSLSDDQVRLLRYNDTSHISTPVAVGGLDGSYR